MMMFDEREHLKWRIKVFGDKLSRADKMILILYSENFSIGEIAKAANMQPMVLKRRIEKLIAKLY